MLSCLPGCGEPEAQCPAADALADANNYAFASELEVSVAPAAEFIDVALSWPALTTDLQGHPVAPEEIDEVLLIAFCDLTPEQTRDALESDVLMQQAVCAYFVCVPTDGVCHLDDFGIGGSYPQVSQYFEEGAYGSILVALNTEGIQGARGLKFLEPLAASAVGTVEIGDTCFDLAVEVDLHSAAHFCVGGGGDVDWSDLTTDGFGNAMSLHTLDVLEVARFPLSVAEMEARFLDLDLLAEERWSADIAGTTSLNFDALVGDRPFPGVDDENTWLLVLRCSTCLNPAPRFITVLSPADG